MYYKYLFTSRVSEIYLKYNLKETSNNNNNNSIYINSIANSTQSPIKKQTQTN
jgi:hypothetical protein